MKYIIDKQKGKAYLQIYEQIKNDIISGVYSFGSKLMSKRLLAEEMGVSIVTVEHAYSLLYEEGYIDSRERSGYFVAYHPDETFLPPVHREKTPLPRQHDTQLDDSFPFSIYAKTMRKILSLYGDDIFTRCSGTGCDELKSAICEYLSRSRGINVGKNQIVIGAGAEYLYGIIVQM